MVKWGQRDKQSWRIDPTNCILLAYLLRYPNFTIDPYQLAKKSMFLHIRIYKARQHRLMEYATKWRHTRNQKKGKMQCKCFGMNEYKQIPSPTQLTPNCNVCSRDVKCATKSWCCFCNCVYFACTALVTDVMTAACSVMRLAWTE